MFKQISVFLATFMACAAFAAVDVNKASEAELDGVKGLGPGTTKLIIEQRKAGQFKNWEDLISRVNGIGAARAARLSADGLTVGGESYKGAGTAAGATKAAEAKTKEPKK